MSVYVRVCETGAAQKVLSHYTVPDGQAFAPHVSSVLKDMDS